MIKFVSEDDLSRETLDALADALDADHPGSCGASCDIDVARDNGFLLAAAYLLRGATETPHVGAVLEKQPWSLNLAWWQQERGWSAHHRMFGVKCGRVNGCGSYTYGDTETLPTTCGGCGATLPAPHWHVDYGVEHWEEFRGELDSAYILLGEFVRECATRQFDNVVPLAEAGDPAGGVEAFKRWQAWSALAKRLTDAGTGTRLVDSHQVHMWSVALMDEVSNPDNVPPGVRVWRCTDEECAPSPWDNTIEHFWGPLPCSQLFGMFELSAHDPRDGTPSVSPDAVVAHLTKCAVCQDNDVRVSADVDGLCTLEWSAVVEG